MKPRFCEGSPYCTNPDCGARHREGEVQRCPSPLAVKKTIKPRRVNRSPAKRGLGDKVALMLGRIGITEDRVGAALQAVGLPPNCGCKNRKEWLNKVGAWWTNQPATAQTDPPAQPE